VASTADEIRPKSSDGEEVEVVVEDGNEDGRDEERTECSPRMDTALHRPPSSPHGQRSPAGTLKGDDDSQGDEGKAVKFP
jgi:hypothetical protein